MKIHEHQARDLLASYSVPVPAGEVVERIEDAPAAFKRVVQEAGVDFAVVKAQVHAGGRGKAGFVKLVRSPDEALEAARFMLTHRMVSVQTGPEGLEVRKLLIAAGAQIERELYLALTTDRTNRCNTLIASARGGVDIEQVAREEPEAILREPIHPLLGLQPHQARRVAFDLGLVGKQVGQAVKIMLALARLYDEKDCSLAEINPLVVTPPSDAHPDGQVLAIDAKINFDDNALFRHKDVAELFDPSEENPLELRAKRVGLNYIAMEGDIGCLVNGAGLAMATMDIIKHCGGEPANFLDVGGSATQEAVTEGFRIILSDEHVQGVLVNIFGGIMRCDVIAQAIVAAAKEVGFKVPLVVRLEGTNVDEGRRILDSARQDIPTMESASDLADAARKVCQ
ncbi:MAG: ADP-forming succinate--CoA ligase subunit beta, partial [Planctomycetota bacterium]